MVGGTDDRLGAVRMVYEQDGVDGHHGILAVLVEVHVVFLIYGLELGVETPDDHVLETVGLHFRPVLYLVRGDVLGVAGHVVGGESVGTPGTDDCH